jgi:hypothetical protein
MLQILNLVKFDLSLVTRHQSPVTSRQSLVTSRRSLVVGRSFRQYQTKYKTWMKKEMEIPAAAPSMPIFEISRIEEGSPMAKPMAEAIPL